MLVDLLPPRAIRLANRRSELARAVVIIGTGPPLGSEELRDVEGFAGSAQVIDALEQMFERDQAAATRAILENTNPMLNDEQLRARIDEATGTVEREAALGRLRALRRVNHLADEAAALGGRLYVVCFETLWYTLAMIGRARELLPEARIELVEDGAISRPDLTAAVVRQATGAAGQRPT